MKETNCRTCGATITYKEIPDDGTLHCSVCGHEFKFMPMQDERNEANSVVNDTTQDKTPIEARDEDTAQEKEWDPVNYPAVIGFTWLFIIVSIGLRALSGYLYFFDIAKGLIFQIKPLIWWFVFLAIVFGSRKRYVAVFIVSVIFFLFSLHTVIYQSGRYAKDKKALAEMQRLLEDPSLEDFSNIPDYTIAEMGRYAPIFAWHKKNHAAINNAMSEYVFKIEQLSDDMKFVDEELKTPEVIDERRQTILQFKAICTEYKKRIQGLLQDYVDGLGQLDLPYEQEQKARKEMNEILGEIGPMFDKMFELEIEIADETLILLDFISCQNITLESEGSCSDDVDSDTVTAHVDHINELKCEVDDLENELDLKSNKMIQRDLKRLKEYSK